MWTNSPATRGTIVNNPNCSEEFLIRVYEDALQPTKDQDDTWEDDVRGDTNIRESIASRADLTRKLISLLLKDPSHYVRRDLAKNVCLTAEDLSLLALDDDENVRQAVVENPNTSNESKAAATLLGLPETESDDE